MRIGIIGCGNMGEAIIKGVKGSAYAKASEDRFGSWVLGYDLDKKKAEHIAKKYKIKVALSNLGLVKKCEVIILAVKPKDIYEVLHEIKYALTSSKLLISVAAGVTTTCIEKGVGKKIAVIRVMPNMPALIGAGISAICKGRFARERDLALARRIFSNLGEVVEVKENLMDAVTAISGSGPAYFFYLVEILIKVGRELGLRDDIARILAIETALGSAKVLKENKDAPIVLRAKVTSKGGTTEAAFKEFFKHNLEMILKKGIRKAYERARCL